MDSKQIRKQAAYEFMNAWRDKDFSGLAEHCQQSWVVRQTLLEIILMGMLGGINILKWRYVDEKRIGEKCYDIILICNYEKQGKQRRTVILRIIDEGKWQINPISVLRNF